MNKYKEIFRLKEMLDEAKIEYEFYDRTIICANEKDKLEFYQICCPSELERYISIIEGWRNFWKRRRHIGNYGVVNRRRRKKR